MNVEDARSLRHMRQFDYARLVQGPLGVVVTVLPMLLHGGAGELECLAGRFIARGLVFQLHDGRDLDASLLGQELHIRVVLAGLRKLI